MFESGLISCCWSITILGRIFSVQTAKGEMMPPDGIDTDLFSGGQILNYEFRDMLSQGDWLMGF